MKTRLSSESCSGYENPSEATPCRFESGPGHQHRVFRRLISSVHTHDLDALRGHGGATSVAALGDLNDGSLGLRIGAMLR